MGRLRREGLVGNSKAMVKEEEETTAVDDDLKFLVETTQGNT